MRLRSSLDLVSSNGRRPTGPLAGTKLRARIAGSMLALAAATFGAAALADGPERLATRLAEVCRVDQRVTGVRVTVRKLHPPIRAMVDYVAVTIEN